MKAHTLKTRYIQNSGDVCMNFVPCGTLIKGDGIEYVQDYDVFVVDFELAPTEYNSYTRYEFLTVEEAEQCLAEW